MPGVLRPYTLIDVLASINDQNGGNQQITATALSTPLSQVGEADEQITLGDTAAAATQSAPGWDQGVWGFGTWG